MNWNLEHWIAGQEMAAREFIDEAKRELTQPSNESDEASPEEWRHQQSYNEGVLDSLIALKSYLILKEQS